MTERLPASADPAALATQLVHDLHTAHPGIVEEWERQRTDAIASGEEDWPDFDSADGALWWLESEITQAESFIAGDETGQEQAIAAYCMNAVAKLRAAVIQQEQP